MKIFELKIAIKLKTDLMLKEYINFISKNINYIFYNSILLRALHEKRGFKPFVVGSMYPIDLQFKGYKKGQIYILSIRSIEKVIIDEFQKASRKAFNLDFDIHAFNTKEIRLGYIDKVYTITPTVLTITDDEQKLRYWTKDDDLLLLQRRIKDNLEKKYIEFFKKSIKAPDDMINFFSIENQKPIVYNYKGGKIFANKLKIGFNSDEVSQKLAKLSFGVGILEKNSLGFGMVVRGKG